MDTFANQNSVNYQTIPPTTVMMAGNHKEDSPMRIDDDIISSNANTMGSLVSGDSAKLPNNLRDAVNSSVNSMLQCGNQSTEFRNADTTSSGMGANPLPEKKPGSNVIVDESPLQLQMEKNKECKYITLGLLYLFPLKLSYNLDNP